LGWARIFLWYAAGVRAVFALALLCGCGGASRARLPDPPRVEAAEVRTGVVPAGELDSLLKRPRSIVKQELTIGIRDRISGRGFEGRGVVVIAPKHALRMILLGPGGTTAMDVWIVDGKFRVAIPAIERVVRGDASTPRSTMRGMPIDLLWRLLVDPFGDVAYARRTGDELTTWMKRGNGASEIRVRSPRGMRAWFFDKGVLTGVATGEETALDDAIVPSRVDYVGTDPAMEVRVVATSAVAMSEVSPAVFADPDAR